MGNPNPEILLRQAEAALEDQEYDQAKEVLWRLADLVGDLDHPAYGEGQKRINEVATFLELGAFEKAGSDLRAIRQEYF